MPLGTTKSSPWCLQGGHQDRAKIYRVACGNRMRDTRHMWKQERVKQAIRKSIFLMRTVKQ